MAAQAMDAVCTERPRGRLHAAMILIDTHCHVQRDDEGASAAAAAPASEGSEAAAARVLYCPMSVDEGDWERVAAMAGGGGAAAQQRRRQHDVFAFALGVHPWHAHRVTAGWQERLQAALNVRPEALVGEVGLDKAARAPDTGRTEWEAQVAVFQEQMQLAARLGRPVSVHCVRAHGAVHDWLRQQDTAVPPAVAMHSYTGSPEMAVSLLSLPCAGRGVFFGFSQGVNLKNAAMAAKMAAVVQRIPRDRILLESDMDTRQGAAAALLAVCDAIGKALGLERPAVAEMGRRNAVAFLRRAV